MNMEFEKKLAIPMEVKEMYPLTTEMAKTVENGRAELAGIFEGKDSRLLLIIGPCSADNEDSVLDYAERLKKVSEKVSEKLVIIPRVYTNKPRTTAGGYKGLVHQPDPTRKPDMFKGIIATRRLHMRVVSEIGFVAADEMLYPENYRYLDDLLGYNAVGARSVEDQQHRLTASGIETPVGMKNPTSGELFVMMNAIHAAQHPHSFLYRGWAVHSQGNPLTHAILRGFNNRYGASRSNYHYEDLLHLCDLYDEMKLANPAVLIDTNHANSGKKPLEQPRIIREVLASANYSGRIRNLLKGFMVESYIEDGAQPVGGGVYGQSITDPCLGWEKTERLIYDLADQL